MVMNKSILKIIFVSQNIIYFILLMLNLFILFICLRERSGFMMFENSEINEVNKVSLLVEI